MGSALVTSDKLPALVRALVSTVNPHDYRLPEYGDDAEIDQGLFSFKGWIEEVELEAGIDEFDPWAADMRSRAFELSKPFESLLNLQSDALKRTWRDAKGRAMIWSESWSDEQLDEERPSAEGHRLVASRLLLDNLMGANGQALLFEMNVERRLISDRYGRDSGKVSDNGAEITTIFTLESQGEVSEFQRNTRTRRRNRRRAGSR